MDGALLNWREGFGTARKKRTTAGPKKQKARQTVALVQKKERVPPLFLDEGTRRWRRFHPHQPYFGNANDCTTPNL